MREIYYSYVAGRSCRLIARELNERGVPSAGLHGNGGGVPQADPAGARRPPRSIDKVRHVLRYLLGQIRLIPQGNKLWAEYSVDTGVLVQVAGAGALSGT